MRYIVRYTDDITGRVTLRPFDWRNDALEFMDLRRERSQDVNVALYAEVDPRTLKAKLFIDGIEMPEVRGNYTTGEDQE